MAMSAASAAQFIDNFYGSSQNTSERVKGFLQVNVGHELAYKHSESADHLRACRFTLRAIVKIAQEVTSTALRYE